MVKRARKPLPGMSTIGAFVSNPDVPDLGNGEQPKHTVRLDRIEAGEWQYRRYFDESSVRELAEEIQERGFHGDVWVYPHPEQTGYYCLISGERRVRACRLAGLDEIPVTILEDLDPIQLAELSYIANASAKALNPLEDTFAVLDILKLHLGWEMEEITSFLQRMDYYAKSGNRDSSHNVGGSKEAQQIVQVLENLKVGIKWRSFVKHRLPLLNKPPEIQEAILAGRLDYTKAIEIAKIKDEEERQQLLEVAIEQGLSFERVKAQVKVIVGKGTADVDRVSQDKVTEQRLGNVRKGLKQKWKQFNADQQNEVDRLITALEQLIAEH